jgi:hypothetical protein
VGRLRTDGPGDVRSSRILDHRWPVFVEMEGETACLDRDTGDYQLLFVRNQAATMFNEPWAGAAERIVVA